MDHREWGAQGSRGQSRKRLLVSQIIQDASLSDDVEFRSDDK